MDGEVAENGVVQRGQFHPNFTHNHKCEYGGADLPENTNACTN